MNDLLLTLYRIQNESGFAPKDSAAKKKKEENLSEFDRQRLKVINEVKNIRKTLTERDQLLEQKPGQRAASQLSAQARDLLKIARTDVKELQRLRDVAEEKMKKKAKKKGLTEDQNQEIERMGEFVELAKNHLKECEAMELRRYGNANIDDDDDDDPSRAVPSALPDIDDEGTIGKTFKRIQENDAKIDAVLDEVSAGVGELHTIAVEMRDEINLQGALLNEMDEKVDKTTTQLETMNKRLKGILEKTRSGSRFMVDFVCILLLVICGGLIYSLVVRF